MAKREKAVKAKNTPVEEVEEDWENFEPGNGGDMFGEGAPPRKRLMDE